MCELFAVNARRARLVNDPLAEFFADSPKHPHGWGLAWHRDDGSLWIDKEPLPAHSSEYLRYLLRAPIRTSWLVAHIRNANRGRVTFENCHPFKMQDTLGTTWVFAHNGTILNESDEFAALSSKQRGATDSERVLLYILDALSDAAAASGHALDQEARFALIAQLAAKLSRGNKLNFMLSDGCYTYVHTNTEQATLWQHLDKGVATICTRPLLGSVKGAWTPLPQCRLLAFCNGELVAESQQHDASIDNDEFLRIIAREQEAEGTYPSIPAFL